MSKHARVLAVPFVLAVLVHAGALRAPFVLDDYAQHAMVEGTYPSAPGPFDLYDFVGDASRHALLKRGIVPWWTHPRLVVRFWRPLASAMLALEHRVFGFHPLLYHLHSLVWWTLACAAVGVLLHRCFAPRVARIGLLVFAMAPCHAVPLVWLANREVLVSTALGTAGLVAYARWREERAKGAGAAALVLFTLAMAAGEYTLAFAGYVAAMEGARRGDTLARRVLGVLPFAVPAAAYLAARSLLGFGASGAGFYHDPLHDPLGYLQAMPRRAGVLLASTWGGLDDVSWAVAPGWELAVATVALGAVLFLPLRRVLGALAGLERERAAWLLGGSLLSILPVLAVEPSRRLLSVAMVGASATVALVLDHAWFPATLPPRRGVAELTGLVALGLGFAHLVRAPLDTWLGIQAASNIATGFESRMRQVGERGVRGANVIVVRAVSPDATLFAPFVLGADAPATWRVLSFATGRSLLLRKDARTIELVASQLPLFPEGPSNLFRDLSEPLGVGERVVVGEMTATVLQTDSHAMPRRVRFEFDRDLDDRSLVWLTEDVEGFHQQPLPPPGHGAPIL
jgi:hypothetical protein